MPTRITTTAPERQTELIRFLCDAFRYPEDAPSVDASLIRWKFFDLHPLWPGIRSYILENETGIAAHAAVIPAQFRSGEQIIGSAQYMDWAAARALPGVGLRVLKYCADEAGTLLSIGGSEDTLRIMPSVRWFRKLPEMHVWVRPVNAHQYFTKSPQKNARAALKAVRNFAWSLYPPLPSSGEWQCAPVDKLNRVFNPSGSFIAIHRTPEWLNFFLACPTIRFGALVLKHAGQPSGHALVSFAGPQLRIVDFAIDSADEKEWIGALSALIRWGSSQPGICEIATGSSLDSFKHLYAAAGMRFRATRPVYLADPKKIIPEDAALEINFLIGDISFLYDRQYPFWC